jgi:RNA polymerase sigma factor (sigma-70 family)
MMSDLELLDQYARENRQEAFAALLDRHLKLVYSAALRQVRSPELAEEVAQSVFTDLARNAGKLEPKTILTAWLYQVTRRTAIDVVRRESRRQLREQIAFDMNNTNSNSSEWTAIEPLLDEAMESLDQSDRTAILLRFFEDKSLREVGQTLGTSEDAAQKRVSRALDLLREYFSKRGRAVAAGGLAAIITANAAQSAPAGLRAAILTSAAFSGASAPLVGTIGITKTLVMTTLQKALIGATLAAALGTGLYEAQRASALQEQMQTLQRQSAPASAQNDSLRQQLDEANRQLIELQGQLKKIHSDNEEVVRLRGEVARLRDNAARSDYDPTATAAKSWLARVNQLKDRLQQTPAAKIPEFQYLTDKDWLNVAKADLNTDEDYRRALADLRNTAESAFITKARCSMEPTTSPHVQAAAKAHTARRAFSMALVEFRRPLDFHVRLHPHLHAGFLAHRRRHELVGGHPDHFSGQPHRAHSHDPQRARRHEIWHPLPGLLPAGIRHRSAPMCRHAAGAGGLRLVRHPNLDRRRRRSTKSWRSFFLRLAARRTMPSASRCRSSCASCFFGASICLLFTRASIRSAFCSTSKRPC